METVLTNLAASIVSNNTRRATLHGRDHIVAPLSLIVPGVLNGSQGPLYYPIEEIARNSDDWNHIPIVVYHPVRNGHPVSARDPDVLNEQGIGVILRSEVNGKLAAEGWFDIDKTRKVDNRVLQALMAGNPMEISTGLYTDNDLADNGAHFEGKPYKFIARNYRPDHLAILPDQKGACSLNDGCGLNVNKCPDCDVDMEGGQCQECGYKEEPTDNAIPNQPKSLVSGKFKRPNAGVGAGDTHEAAQAGHAMINDRQRELGADAKAQADSGTNPPGWAVDEGKWERAKEAADKGDYGEDTYWAVVAHIYQNMGGTVGSTTENWDHLTDNGGPGSGPHKGGGSGKDPVK